ncbi:MAG TPA: hypothetical protein VFF17_10945 [Thermoanaerobaculia bacterium]|nr:hypothetical protein [Thermoanaerobaculia bacterium]
MNLSRIASPRTLVPALALAAGLVSAAPAHGASCIQGYAQCLVDASDLATWWQRTAAGIDCYLDTVACLKGAYG